MALWGISDTFTSVPKYLQPKETFNGTTAVSADDDTITIPNHPFENGDEVLYTSSAAAAELTSGDTYYIVERTNDTVKLSATSGGSAINIVTVNGAADDTLQLVADPAAVFVDTAEAAVSANVDRGVKTAGWNTFKTWTTNGGTVTRYSVEPIVAATVTASDAADNADDAIAADAELSIDTQPQSVSVTAPDPATFTVVASTNTDDAVITYQWQVNDGGGYEAIAGATDATYVVEDSTGLDGYLYRVVVTADINGEVIPGTSNAATLTVA